MKKQIIFILAFCIQFLSLQAQITFEKNYHALVKDEAIQSVEEDGNGGYYAAVGTQRETLDSLDTLALTRVNAYGDTLWQKKFLINHYPQVVALKKQNGFCYIMGTAEDTVYTNYRMFWLAKFDTSGNFLWKKNYQDIKLITQEDKNGLIVLPNGKILISTTYVGFLLLDSNGNILNLQRYGPYYSPSYLEFQKVKFIQKDSSFYYVLGYTPTPPFNALPKMLRVDQSGDTIGSYPVDIDSLKRGMRTIKAMPNGFIVGGGLTSNTQLYLSHIDSAGVKLWIKKVNNKTLFNSFFASTATLKNGNIVIAGFPYHNIPTANPQGKAFLYCFNDSGDSLWYKEFRADSLHKTEFYDVLATSDSGMIACGQILMPDGSRQSYLVKLDENGNLFNPLSVVEKQQQSYLHLYPNPARDYTRFHYIGKEAQAILRISDLQGREVYHQPISGKDFRFTLNTSDFAPGYYFCSIISDGHAILTKKLVVIGF